MSCHTSSYQVTSTNSSYQCLAMSTKQFIRIFLISTIAFLSNKHSYPTLRIAQRIQCLKSAKSTRAFILPFLLTKLYLSKYVETRMIESRNSECHSPIHWSMTLQTHNLCMIHKFGTINDEHYDWREKVGSKHSSFKKIWQSALLSIE